MPHRTVFQVGKNHAHPFTMFIGGLIIGSLVTGFGFLAYQAADNADVDIRSNSVSQPAAESSASPSVSPRPSASPSAAVSF